MPVRSTSHFAWQVLRAAKRSKKPLTGRALRLMPTRTTKDGAFLTELVEAGLLVHISGSAEAPFEATYALTEKGQHAAEYGEYEYELKRPASVEPKTATVPAKKTTFETVPGDHFTAPAAPEFATKLVALLGAR